MYLSLGAPYALWRDAATGAPVFSILMSNQLAEYDEWYHISEQEFEQLLANPDSAVEFASRCARQELDDRLVLKPGASRGVYLG